MKSKLVAFEAGPDVIKMLEEYVEDGYLDWYHHSETLYQILDPLAHHLIRVPEQNKKSKIEKGKPTTQEELEYLILDVLDNVTDNAYPNSIKSCLMELLATQQNRSLLNFYHYYNVAILFLLAFGFIELNPMYMGGTEIVELVYKLTDKGKDVYEKVTSGEITEEGAAYYVKMYERWKEYIVE